MDEWIVIPNWDTYQHYKQRDPVWLRDYVRQLWNDQWLDLNLTQRGLLWTIRLAYAHHNGRLRLDHLRPYLSDDTSTRHLRPIARRVNQAGLLGFVASTPLSLKDLNPLLHARARDANGRAPACEFCEVGGGRHAADCPTLAGMPA